MVELNSIYNEGWRPVPTYDGILEASNLGRIKKLARTFILEANHKDEDKQNNRAENLEWCTHQYNSVYGTRRDRISHRIKDIMPTKAVVSDKGETFDSIHEAAEYVNGSAGNIVKQLKGQIKTAYGRTWKHVK